MVFFVLALPKSGANSLTISLNRHVIVTCTDGNIHDMFMANSGSLQKFIPKFSGSSDWWRYVWRAILTDFGYQNPSLGKPFWYKTCRLHVEGCKNYHGKTGAMIEN
jgi:hypothetical protein